MTIRTTEKTVTFERPFVLAGFDEVLPAGDYSVEIDEELLQGLSFPAFHRVRAVIALHPTDTAPGRTRTLTIAANVLDAALARDRATVAGPSPQPGNGTGKADRRAIERGENEGMALHGRRSAGAAVSGSEQ
ncbi:MAG: hypothetical protein COW30_13925 [Rhodospirillales bacterium CG15_BIG_FIL_POST_REV_8_21_14_020_66_15]|nr:MAG: hypothetical protein COW30_13925 [Rhodospirillales bacterium CG15_BIG_FIL_POST_REV_8_21_14_020_66_15]